MGRKLGQQPGSTRTHATFLLFGFLKYFLRSRNTSWACFPFSAGLPATVCRSTPFFDTFFIAIFADVGWLTGDLIAGLTVGMVVVPQGMSYAQVSPIQIQSF